MIHYGEVKRYAGSMNELAEDIGNLRYDALADFLNLLAAKIEHDGDKDRARKRLKLANELHSSADSLRTSATAIDRAWVICKPFMPKDS